MKVFGPLRYAHIPSEKRCMLDSKAFKCRFMRYEDGVKGYRVFNVAMGKVQIVCTVKFMETTDSGQLMMRLEIDEDEETGEPERQSDFLPPLVPTSDVTSIVEARRRNVTTPDVTPVGAAITTYTDHPMITRSRARLIDEITNPEDGGTQKARGGPIEDLDKRQKVDQADAKADDKQLTIEGEMLMTVNEEVPRSHNKATTSDTRGTRTQMPERRFFVID
ncbi:unnamed protein product [Phytophthora fragariaefolia]|uniref:Unnamed protein product n=1 Tax=Phytophthora fragariaefolia TaxID=1490495 RepID=A0A9W6XB09_9STRA|nr:unnamed protein product [Phytophthora fragariaefolia]